MDKYRMKMYRISKSDDYEIFLPGQDFFKPKPDFLKFLKQLVGSKVVIECGAGNGLLTKKMKEMNINVLPIDLFKRDSDFIAIKQDATTFQYPKNGVALIARPSRGDWIHQTILRAIESTSFMIYIGLSSHVDEDIYELVNLYSDTIISTEIYKDAGEDGEIVFKISKKDNKIMSKGDKYYLVKYKAAKDLFFTSWFEDGGNKWIGFAGGFFPKSNTDIILEEQFASDIHELDWKKTTIYKPNSVSGWLGRDGTFIGCDYQQHDLVADLILNKSVKELEKDGWVRIYDENDWTLSPDQLHLRLTPEQRNHLSFHGYRISDED